MRDYNNNPGQEKQQVVMPGKKNPESGMLFGKMVVAFQWELRYIHRLYVPVAQLDRALASGAKGHRFESCRARHKNQGVTVDTVAPFCVCGVFVTVLGRFLCRFELWTDQD